MGSPRHYEGAAGVEYASGRFTPAMAFGRRYQAHHFRRHVLPQDRVLDFGCGDGSVLRELQARERFGVEINPQCRAAVESANGCAVPPVRLFRTIEEVPARSVDVVISNHALEHVPHPLRTLAELHRVLVPGGRLVVVVPFDDWRGPANRRWRADDRDHHLYTWSPANLGNLVTEAGFAVRDVELHAFAWSPRLFWTYRCFGAFGFRVAGRLLARLRRRREVSCLAEKHARAEV